MRNADESRHTQVADAGAAGAAPPVRAPRLWRAVRCVLGASQPSTAAGTRYARIAQAVLSSLAGKGIALIVSIITVPVAIRYLGGERYGAWMTISSLVAWASIADIGLGSELTNQLSRTYAVGDDREAQVSISTTFFVLAGIALLLAIAGVAAWPFIHWAALLNVSASVSELGLAIGIALLLVVFAFPLAVVERVYNSYQQGVIANVWGALGSVASLVAVLAATSTSGGLVALVLASGGTQAVMKFLNAAWLFGRFRPALRPRLAAVNGAAARHLVGKGTQFFVIQISALVLSSTDNIVIARILGPAEVTPYSVAWRLFSIPMLLLGLPFPYLWATYAEALAKQDAPWIRRTVWLTSIASTGAALAVAVPLALFGCEIIAFWAGEVAMPPRSVLWWMAAWTVLFAPVNSLVCFVNASGRIRWQVWVGVISAAANIALSIVWARSFGIAGVIAGTVVSYALLSVGPVLVVSRRVMAEVALQSRQSGAARVKSGAPTGGAG